MGGGTRSDGVVEDVLFAARMAAGSGTELTADPLEFVRTSESISYALRESISRTEARFRRAGRPGVVEWWSDGDGGMVHGSGFGVHGWGLNSHRQRRLCHRGRQSDPDLAPEKDSGQGIGVKSASLRILRLIGAAQFFSELQEQIQSLKAHGNTLGI
jgi:hypothetical protein